MTVTIPAAPTPENTAVTPAAVAPTAVENTPAPAATTTETPPAPETVATEAAPTPEPTPEVKAEEKPAEKTEAKTILGAEKQPEKAAETKPEGEKKPEEKKDEVSQSADPAPLPAYEPFKLPEGITADTDRLGVFTKDLGEFENRVKANPAEIHTEMQNFAQGLVDQHITEVQNTVKRLNEAYINNWEKQKSDWKDAFIADPEIGGKQQETTVKSALEFIRTHGGTEVHQKEFRELMETTGVGNHPAMIRILANAMKANAEPKPLPANSPIPQNQSKVAKRYGNKS